VEAALVNPSPSPALTLRLSVTDRCDLRCRYCMPAAGVAPVSREELLSFEEIVEVVRAIQQAASPVAVRFTGGEPLLRKGLAQLVAMLSAEGVCDLALTTNGQLLADAAAELKSAGLRRVNLSLDTLDPKRFVQISRSGDLSKTLAGIEAALECRLTPVKLNAVLMQGVNDDESVGLARFALERGCQLRFIELMAIGEALVGHADRFVPTAEVRARLETAFRFEPRLSDARGPATVFPVQCRLSGRRGTLGFISPRTHPFCEGCRRLRLTSRGELRSCLMHEQGRDLRALLRNGGGEAALVTAVQEALSAKAVSGTPPPLNRSLMAEIGG